MAIYVTARFRAQPQRVDEGVDAIRTSVEAVEATEPGTRLYLSLKSEDDPNEFLHVFVFQDEAAEETHRTSSAVIEFTDHLYPLLQEDVEFRTFRRVAGISVKGPV